VQSETTLTKETKTPILKKGNKTLKLPERSRKEQTQWLPTDMISKRIASGKGPFRSLGQLSPLLVVPRIKRVRTVKSRFRTTDILSDEMRKNGQPATIESLSPCVCWCGCNSLHSTLDYYCLWSFGTGKVFRPRRHVVGQEIRKSEILWMLHSMYFERA
jgi:hypothetical protein